MPTENETNKIIDSLVRLGAKGWRVCDFDRYYAGQEVVRPHGVHWCTTKLIDGYFEATPVCGAGLPAQSRAYNESDTRQTACDTCAELFLASKESHE